MKRVPVRLRPGQLVIVEWMDAAGAGIEKGAHLPLVRVRTVGWIWERTARALTIHSEIFLSGHVEGDARDGTTIMAAMLRKVRVLCKEGTT